MEEVVSINEHKVVLILFKEGESVEVTVAWGIILSLDSEINLREIFSGELLNLLLSNDYLNLHVKDWYIIELPLNVVSMVFREQGQVLLHFFFALYQLF